MALGDPMQSFNRTFMELKHIAVDVDVVSAWHVLIGPSWN